jgi:glycosyltransferase involved in cell wall biosynthesis
MVDHGFLNPVGPFYRMTRRLERLICHLPDAILTSSMRAQEDLRDEFGVTNAKIHALPDCVDMERFNPGILDDSQKRDLKEALGIPNDRVVVAYLGLMADYQGIPQLIEAAAQLSRSGANIHFLMMGYPRVDQYRQRAHAAGVADRMTFTGKIGYKDAPRHLALGDLAVSAKVSATEGSGKVLNYMAMAQPVVASDTPVHREYLGSLGIYGTPGDAQGLANGIQNLLRDLVRARELGEQLQDRAREHYSWTKAGQRIDALYRSLIE